MKKNRFIVGHAAFALKNNESGLSVETVSQKMVIPKATIGNLNSRSVGLSPSQLKRLRQFEEEIIELKLKWKHLFLDNAL